MSRIMTEWYDRWAEFDCPTCGKYFNFKFQQHEHAAKTGHKKAELCGGRHPKGRGFCKRAKDHDGWCAYPGSQYVVIWIWKQGRCYVDFKTLLKMKQPFKGCPCQSLVPKHHVGGDGCYCTCHK